MTQRYGRWLILVLLAVFGFCDTTIPLKAETATGTVSERFIAQYLHKLWLDQQLKTKQNPIHAIAQSPWTPYLKPHYGATLSPHDQNLFQKALKMNNCKSLEGLEQKGFVQTYPDLAPLFSHNILVDQFHKQVLALTSYPVLYCRSVEAFDKAGAQDLPPVDWQTSYEDKSLSPRDGIRYRAIKNLELLAQCGDYLPAQLMLLRLSGKPVRFAWSFKRRASLAYHVLDKTKGQNPLAKEVWSQLEQRPDFRRLADEDLNFQQACPYKDWRWVQLSLF